MGPAHAYDPNGLIARFPELTARVVADPDDRSDWYIVQHAGQAPERHDALEDAIAGAQARVDCAFLTLIEAGRILVVDGQARLPGFVAPADCRRDPAERIAELLASGNQHLYRRRELSDVARDLVAALRAADPDGARQETRAALARARALGIAAD
ncbi:hypothetical protein CKO28_04995 [Rhodovibrio sodomensis]|uniref:Uncharacterized protein n=2 Tax=Rhodovibrio sodomensis TaxID=1088 RepID=A0ABS1DDA0_9PROT|nr:hypothetical protein [Rhodovibrio sodomensis]